MNFRLEPWVTLKKMFPTKVNKDWLKNTQNKSGEECRVKAQVRDQIYDKIFGGSLSKNDAAYSMEKNEELLEKIYDLNKFKKMSLDPTKLPGTLSALVQK